MEREEGKTMTRIALDIDGTLGYRNRQQYLLTCKTTLKLALADDVLQGISLETFAQLPEVRAYRARVGDAYYTKALGWIDYHPDVLRAMHPLPGAREGVARLATVGSVAYYTARYSAQSQERSQAMAEATQTWLTVHAFAHPTNTVFCDGLPGKLRQLARDLVNVSEPVILIDDQWTRLLQRCAELDEATIRLLQGSLLLVAYGAATVPEQTLLPVVALPSWEESAVTQMLEGIRHLLVPEEKGDSFMTYQHLIPIQQDDPPDIPDTPPLPDVPDTPPLPDLPDTPVPGSDE